MWYVPYMRVRRAVVMYSILILAVALVTLAVRFWPGAMQLDAAGRASLADARVDISMLISGAAALVAGFATVLGLNLAAENDGHLELAWTKAVSREGYALGVFAVDLAAIAVCIIVGVACAAVTADIFAGHQVILFGSAREFFSALAFCGLPVCVYAWIAALSASLKRNRATAAGLFWPLMIAVAVLSFIPIQAVHVLATGLNALNPLEIYFTSSASAGQSASVNGESSIARGLWGWGVAGLLLATALAQWRRLEI